MPQIIRFHETGGPDVLEIENLPLIEPGEGEVRLKVEAFSLNRADVMFRQGQYLEEPELPSRLAAALGSLGQQRFERTMISVARDGPIAS